MHVPIPLHCAWIALHIASAGGYEMKDFKTMNLQRFSAVQQVFIQGIILLGLATSAFAACQASADNDYELETEIWTEWYSNDDPVSGGEDYERKTDIYPRDSRCTGEPTDVQCRAKYSKINYDSTGESSVTCTTGDGLRCQNSAQSDGMCLDYEIRFKCEDATPLPIPEYHLEFSGKTNLDDMDPVKCDSTGDTLIDRKNRLSGTVYDNRLFYMQDGRPNADHSCALWTGSTSVIDILPFLSGICISEPLCCVEGLTLEFWTYIPAAQTVAFTCIFGTGGHIDGRTGVSVQIFDGLLEFNLRYSDTSDYHIESFTDESLIVGKWIHFTGVFHTINRMACSYIDGQDISTQGCKPEWLLPALTPEDFDNMRLFDRSYANPVVSKRSPDAKMSDMKIYFSYMTADQVAELHRRETLVAHVHVYYVGIISDLQYEDVVLECKAHGSYGGTIEFKWLTSSDGVEFVEIDPASDPYIFVYNVDLMNDYQHVSRLHFINHTEVQTQYTCEGYDPATMRTSSQSFNLTFPSGESTWSPWISSDSPDGNSDDIESLTDIRNDYPQVCSEPLDVECRTLYTKEDFGSTGQTFSHACTTTDGLQCIGSAQTGGRCLDYEVRFLCPGVNYRWTDWCDVDDGGSSDDDETFSQHKSQGCAGLCEFPLFAECRTITDDQWYDVSNIQLRYPYICTKEGLYCDKDDNSGNCLDFKVRYACPYYPGVYPDYKWELGGRSVLTDEFTSNCGSLSVDTFLSTIPAASANGLSSSTVSFISAPSSVEAHCSPLLTASINMNLGDFSSSCITDASLCADGTTFSFWFQPVAASGADKAYFISTGSQIETSKGLAFYQQENDGDFVIFVKTRFKAWEAVFDKTEFPENVWKHVIISITPFVGISCYIDGVLKETVTEYSSSTYNIEYPTAVTRFVLGAENDLLAENGDASFSDIRVYESALQECHVTAFALCGEADGQVNVSTLVSTSHFLNPTLTLECQAWGSPAPTIEWVWLEDIDLAGAASTVGAGASTSETNSVVGCWKTSTLTIPDYASSVYANKDIVCKATNDVEYDLQSIHVDPVGPCEISLGVSSGTLKAMQFEDSVSGTLSEVPGLDATYSWEQQSASDLIIDLVVDHMISGIALQVHQDPAGSAYVPSVDIDYEDNSETWQLYEAFSLGTIDASAASTHWFSFSTPQNTSKLRVHPDNWISGTQLRIELYGCQVEDLPHEVNVTGGYDYMANTFTAVCTASAYPAPTLVWQFGGGTLDMGRYSIENNVGISLSTSTLEINPFEAGDDNITFSCQSTSSQGVLVDSLESDYGFNGSVVLSGPSSVALGASFAFTCDVTGDAVYSLDWFFQLDGIGMASLVQDVFISLARSDTSLLVPGGGTATLQFFAMESSHSGTYICSVNNGTKSDSIEVSEYVIPGNVTITGNSSVYDRGTNSFTLSCNFDYDGDYLNISWIVPDMMEEIFGNWSNSKLDILSLESSSFLMIQSFNFSSDDGDYTCRGRTSGGGEVDYDFTIHYAFSGAISLTSSSNIFYGDTVVLTATVQGDTVYHVAWYYAETNTSVESLITQSGNILLSDTNNLIGEGGIANLTIVDFTTSDDGVYTIVINNGSAEDSVHLYGREPVGNVTITGNTSNYHPESNTYLLTCEFVYDGLWLNISWVTPSSPEEIFSNYTNGKYEVISECCSSPATSSLLIYAFNYTIDDGSYQCQGFTSGSVSVSFNHDINYAFSGAISLTSSSNIFYGDTVVLTATVQGDTVYHVAWYYAETNNSVESLITQSGNILLSDTNNLIGAGGIANLTIMDFTTSDDGVYTIVINNGSAEDSVHLYGREPVGNVTITGNTSNYHPESNTYLLTCEFVYDGLWLNVSWVTPSSPEEIFSNYTNGKYEVISECCSSPATSSLLIYAFNYTIDDGSYQCQGYTSGSVSVSFNHDINYEFTGTITLTINEVVQYGLGALVCQMEGDMVYDMEWQFMAEGSSMAIPIVNSGTVWTSNSTQGIGTMSATSELRIDNWPSENDGTYYCQVNQGSGQDNAQVIGATLESIFILTSCNSSTEVCIVTCVVSYTSITPNITWYAPPVVSEISPGEVVGRISVSEENNPGEISSTFTITAADSSTDNINYTCRASLFDVLYLQNTTELLVPIADEASIVQLEGEYNGTIQHYWLQCTVTFIGIPANISWTTPTGDNVTETSTKFTVLENLNGNNITSVLLVNSSNFQQDDGFYTCHATQNNVLQHSENVAIFQAYSGPLDMYLTNPITLGDTVILECVAGDPVTAFDIQWYHTPTSSATPAQLITNSPLHDVTVWTNGTESLVSRLHVNLFSVNENGVYTCSVNGGSKDLNLTVEEIKDKVDLAFILKSIALDSS